MYVPESDLSVNNDAADLIIGRTLSDYHKLLIVEHDKSSNFDKAEPQRKDLYRLDRFEIETISSSADPAETQGLILEKADDGTIVVVYSGDGTGRIVIEALMGTTIPIWKGRVGNGDNLGRTFFPLGHRSRPRVIDQLGRIERAKALSCIIEGETGRLELVVPDLIGFGETGLSAYDIDEARHREIRNKKHTAIGQILSDARVIRKTVKESEPFRVERDGKELSYDELMFANLGTIARIGNLNVNLSDPWMLEVAKHYRFKSIESKYYAAKLALWELNGKRIKDGDPDIHFKVIDGVIWQASGDAYLLYPGDEVTISRTDEYFYYVTTRQHP